MVKKTQTAEEPASKISIQDGKIIVTSFRYKKADEKYKKKYAERQLDIPGKSGETVRVYLEKNGTITTQNGPEHELILAEFTIPHDEYEEIEKKVKGKKIVERKKKVIDLTKINVKNFDIPDRS